MSDLQLALLVLGALIIIAVVIYNWWQERNLRAEAETRFQAPSHDILMDDRADNDREIDAHPGAYEDERAFDDEDAVAPSASVTERPWSTPTRNERIEPTFDESRILASFEEDDDKESYPLPEAVASTEREPIPEPSSEVPFAQIPEDLPEPEPMPVAATQQPSKVQSALPEDVDHKIDLIAQLQLAQPASGLTLREFRLTLTDIDKPIYAYGMDDDGVWHLLTREQEEARFSEVVCAVQLADRSGPISSAALSRFRLAVQGMATQLASHIAWLGEADPATYANELDQFCIEVDKMVGFHLVQSESGPFTGTKFRGLAESRGLLLHEDGSFYYESEHEQPSFSLTNQDDMPFSAEKLRTSVIRGVTFRLDIPRVRNCLEAFNHMVLTARQMETSLSARLVDDNHRPLGEAQIEQIRQQLKIIQGKMSARGIAPGSGNALRLFS